MRTVSVVLLVAGLLVACGNDPGPGGTPSMTDTPTGSSASSVPPGGPADQAKADLAQRLGVDAAQVRLVSSEEVTWPDGSLGCPEPGMRYTQALVPGNRTVLEVDGKQYSYHSGGSRAPFLCEHPQGPAR
ncbi:hypothetical protein [Kribbella sp. NPDC004875]|uniref:hypothetical protein n=1 Tax=Kribbella sp. NPDC004875 TaxID=3364107 RepID=UPI0036818B09